MFSNFFGVDIVCLFFCIALCGAKFNFCWAVSVSFTACHTLLHNFCNYNSFL